jgi:hypothetical protein
MAFRPFLPSMSELPSTSGLALAMRCPACQRTAPRERDARGHLPSAGAQDDPARRPQAAPRSIVAATAREMRETLAGVALIVRFAGFVAAILARHHLRRLRPGAAARKSWLGAPRAAPSGRAAGSMGRL